MDALEELGYTLKVNDISKDRHSRMYVRGDFVITITKSLLFGIVRSWVYKSAEGYGVGLSFEEIHACEIVINTVMVKIEGE